MIISRQILILITAGILSLPSQKINAQTQREIILDNPSGEETIRQGVPLAWRQYQEKGTQQFLLPGAETAHDGKSCLSIKSNDPDGVGSWIYTGGYYVDARNAGYKIKGGTTYEFSAWVKTDTATNSPGLLVWEFENGKAIASHTSSKLTGNSPWKKTTCRFTTKGCCTGLQLRLNLFGKGQIFFDNVSLVEINESKDSASSNLLKNSSFEITSVPSQPDDWGISGGGDGLGGLIGAHYTEKHFDWFTIDNMTSYEGKNSFRLHRPYNDSDPDAADYKLGDFIFGSDWQLHGEIEGGSPYTLSCYLKADSPDLKIKIIARGRFGSYSSEEKVSTSWKRYVLTSPVLKGDCKNMCIDFIPLQKGTFWIDAIQLEKGDKATAYMPSKKDALATGKEKFSPVPKTICTKIQSAPELDGKLDDACYSELPRLQLLQLNGKAPIEASDAYIYQHEGDLYIGMKCRESQMDKLKLTAGNGTGTVWEDDSAEIFIEPELNSGTYYRLIVNADGIKYSDKMLGEAWSGNWDAKTFKGKDFWSLEMKIPLHCFGVTPGTGSSWGINLCRNNRVKEEYSNWSPVYDGGFHSPKRFGQASGIDTAKLKAYCYSLGGLSLSPRLENKTYDVSVNLSNLTGSDRQVIVEASIKNGKENSSESLKIDLEKGESKKINIGPFNTEEKEINLAKVKLIDPATGNILTETSAAKLKIPTPLELISELNYYTDESDASIFIRSNITGSEPALQGMMVSLEVKDVSGAVIFTKEIPFTSGISSIKIPIGGFKCADYPLTARLKDRTGKLVCETSDILRKLTPKPSCIKENRMNRMLVIDGKTIIPVIQTFSVFMHGNKESKNRTKAFYDKVMARYSRDFDSICIYYYGIDKDIPSLLDIARKNNLKIYFGGFQDFDYSKEAIQKYAPLIKDHPALASWPEMLDENVANDKVAATAFDRWKLLQEIDPYHVRFIRNHCVSLASWAKFGYPGEVLEYHDYVFSSNREGVPFWARHLKVAGRIAKESRRPFLAMPQTFSSMQWWSRGPTAAEMEASVYLALINGATIIQYYIFDQAERQLWLRVRSLTKEIRELTPALASYAPSPEIGSSSPKIQTLVKYFEGHYYILSVNSSADSLEASLDLSALGLPGNAEAKLLFENRTIEVKDGILKDSFAGYQRHVYIIEKARSVQFSAER